MGRGAGGGLRLPQRAMTRSQVVPAGKA